MIALVLLAGMHGMGQAAVKAADPFAALEVYSGRWEVRLEHPWGGGPAGSVDRLVSHCERYTQFFACEQTINGKAMELMVYTPGDGEGKLHTRYIDPEDKAAPRGELTVEGDRLTYVDKPSGEKKGKWYRVVNVVVDRDHIREEESESADEGVTWTKTNGGVETRVRE